MVNPTGSNINHQYNPNLNNNSDGFDDEELLLSREAEVPDNKEVEVGVDHERKGIAEKVQHDMAASGLRHQINPEQKMDSLTKTASAAKNILVTNDYDKLMARIPTQVKMDTKDPVTKKELQVSTLVLNFREGLAPAQQAKLDEMLKATAALENKVYNMEKEVVNAKKDVHELTRTVAHEQVHFGEEGSRYVNTENTEELNRATQNPHTFAKTYVENGQLRVKFSSEEGRKAAIGKTFTDRTGQTIVLNEKNVSVMDKAEVEEHVGKIKKIKDLESKIRELEAKTSQLTAELDRLKEMQRQLLEQAGQQIRPMEHKVTHELRGSGNETATKISNGQKKKEDKENVKPDFVPGDKSVFAEISANAKGSILRSHEVKKAEQREEVRQQEKKTTIDQKNEHREIVREHWVSYENKRMRAA